VEIQKEIYFLHLFGKPIFSRIAKRTLAKILYTLPAKLMGLKDLLSSSPATLGIKVIKIAFKLFSKTLLL